MSDEAIKVKDLAVGETETGGEGAAGGSEKSLFDALDDIMNIANRASGKGAGNGNGTSAGINGSAAKPNGTAGTNGAAKPVEAVARDQEIEQSLSDALDEIMNGGTAQTKPAPVAPKARDAVATAAKPAAARPAAMPGSKTTSKAGSFTENLLYQMLSELKSDIDVLRRESETTKAKAFAMQPPPDEASDSERFMYNLLAELKSDIDALKHETGTLGTNAIGARGNSHEAELYSMLSTLRSDITTLKAESEAFMHHGGIGMAQVALAERSSTMRPVLIGAVTAIAILAAGAGGFFFANMQRDAGQPAAVAMAPAPVAAAPAEPVASEPARSEAASEAAAPASTEVKTRSVTTTAVDGGKAISAEEEGEMLTRAEKLLDQGDIVAARMILDYAVSEGSATAAFRLAQTYDPKYLATANLAIEAKADVTQALMLYYFAARSGHEEAAARMAELKRETGAN
ncbi:MAG: hypothetical protein R3D02_16145 [Hyphomicrobiales bacterium]